MPSLYPHEVRKIAQGAGAASGFAGFFFPSLRARGLGEEKPVPSYSAIVYKEGDEVRAEDWKGRKIASGEAGVDDASVIQSAINAISSRGGGEVFLKVGEYLIKEQILIDKDNIIIRGQGVDITKIIASIDRPLYISASNNIVLKDFTLDGQGSTLRGIVFYSEVVARNVLIENIRTFNIKSSHILFWGTDNSLENCYTNVLIRNVECEKNPVAPSDSLVVLSIIKDAVVENCYFHDAEGESALSLNGQNIFVINTVVENTYGGFCIEKADRSTRSINIIGGEARYCNYGLELRTGRDVRVIGTRFYRNKFGVKFYDEYSHKDIRIIGCHFEEHHYPDSANAVIQIQGTSVENIEIKDCTFYNNCFAIGWSPAIQIRTGKRITIVNNSVIDDRDTSYTRWGVQIDNGTVEDLVVARNHFVGIWDTAIGLTNSPVLINIIIKDNTPNTGKTSASSGVATFSGDGSTTQFSIPHSLISEPSKIQVTPMTEDSAGDFYVTKDSTNIYVNYLSPPPSGSNNVKLSWYAEV